MSTIRILVLDDNVHLLRLYSKALRKTPYTFDTASNLQEARNLLATTRYDLFLCDVYMQEEQTGFDLLREQVDRLRAQGTQIVVMSAQDTHLDSCRELGIEDYIFKPIFPEALITMVEKLMQNVSQDTSV
jgi:two-component system, OmpR family, response regulator